MPLYQITHTFAVSMAAAPVAHRCMGFNASRAQKDEGVICSTWFPMDASGRGVTYSRR